MRVDGATKPFFIGHTDAVANADGQEFAEFGFYESSEVRDSGASPPLL